MFGGGRGDVEKVKNKIKKIHTTSNFGPLRTDTDNYSGSVYYEQRFYNHPIEEHGSFSHSNSIRVIDAHGSIRNGYVGYTNVKISGPEVHPDDAYDGGDHPYDAYTYHVDGTVKTTSIQPIELPKLPNPFDKNKENADKGNQNNGQPENSDVANNGEVPLPKDVTKTTGREDLPPWLRDGAAGFGDALSFGGSKYVRDAWDIDGVNENSQAYSTGEFIGDVYPVSIPVVGVAGKAANVAGKAKAVDNVAATAGKTKINVTAQNGIPITGFTKHGLNRAIERNVSTPSILDAVKNPLQIKNVKVDSMGRESQRFIGSKASVVVNPNTEKVVSVNPTSTQKVKSLGGSK